MINLRNILVGIAFVAGTAHGASAETFGDAGVVALSSDANVSLRYAAVSPGDASSSSFVLVPAVDYFVAKRVSVGGFALLSSTSTTTTPDMDTTTTLIGIGPRVGYAVELGSRFTLWPKLGVSWVRASVDGASDSRVALGATARVLYHPIEHFFVGFGPDINIDVTGDVRTTSLGASWTLGGWL